MRRKICKEKCPFCHQNDATVIASSTQFRCKRCKKYFKRGTKRKEYSKEALIAIRTIIDIFYGNIPSKGISIKKFVKNILEKLEVTIHNLKIGAYIMPRGVNSLAETTLRVNGKLTESIILTRVENRFQIIRGLDVRQKIVFNDFIIHTSGHRNISKDYYFGIDDEHYK